jgi:succinate dehydrogenase / fumarate reductase cytochrome b subunit
MGRRPVGHKKKMSRAESVCHAAREDLPLMGKDFILRRLHSLLGLLPLFIFVPVHMVQGAIPYFTLELKPVSWPFMFAFGIIPFTLHAALGLYIYVQNRANPFRRKRGTFFWLFRLQITSSFVILIFVITHKMALNLLWRGAGFPFFVATAILFMAGIAAVAFHMGYGLYTFCISWGVSVDKHVRVRIGWGSAAFGAIFCAAFMILYFFVFMSLKQLVGL